MNDLHKATLNLHHVEILLISQKSNVHLVIEAVKPIGILVYYSLLETVCWHRTWEWEQCRVV